MMDKQQVDQQALFEGLVYNESGQVAQVVHIGGVAHYAIPDDGFLRHVEAAGIDSKVLASIKGQITGNQDLVIRGVLEMMGKDDLFTKAAVESSILNMEQNIRQSDPSQWLPWLRFMGFRVVVNVHGEVVELMYPSQAAPDDDEGE
ncbi:MAG: hypothetical protein ACYCZF_08240 [Anaerolineae bacterium]